MSVSSGPAPARSVLRESLSETLAESAFHADRGIRPPAQRVRPEHVGAIAARLSAATRHELLTFDDPSGCIGQGVPERMLAHAATCVREVVARVPHVRQITSRRGLARDAEVGTIRWRDGGQARLIDEIPFRMGVMDRSVALVPVDLDVLYNGMLLVRDPVVVRALVRAHQRSWQSGEDPSARPCDEEPPAHLLPVLDCLLAGLTDEAGAARIGLSARTYCRRVGDLLALLGADSRFQAGALAIRKGWA
ncbi:DNA-binding response regulator [Embleya sp. NPDC008237]|uniref:DNA-binding response regulator n=1 Tax=Embleya sp. NPDC008237 TaxID=3363978 RepID=UPI0036E8143C